MAKQISLLQMVNQLRHWAQNPERRELVATFGDKVPMHTSQEFYIGFLEGLLLGESTLEYAAEADILTSVLLAFSTRTLHKLTDISDMPVEVVAELQQYAATPEYQQTLSAGTPVPTGKSQDFYRGFLKALLLTSELHHDSSLRLRQKELRIRCFMARAAQLIPDDDAPSARQIQ